MNLRDIAKKVGSYISSKTQDDEGFFRQGKFTPVKQVQQIGQNIGQTKLPSGRTLAQLPNDYMQSFSQSRSLPEKLMNIGTSSFLKASSFGLLQPQAPKAETIPEKFMSGLGGLTGFIGPGSLGGKAMTGIDKLGQAGIMKFAPKLQTTLAGKIAGGLGKEALQTGAYMGGKYIAGKAGLRPDEKITGKSVLQDLAIGAAMRGITTPGNLGAIRKAISPDVWTSDRSVINEAMQRIKVNETVDEFSDIGKNLKNMYKEYGLASYPNWNKLPQRQQVQVLSDRLDEMARSGFDVKMGIKDQSSPIKTGGEGVELGNKIEFPKGYYEDPTFRNMSPKEFLEYANKNSDFRINVEDEAALKAIANNENLGYFSPEQIKKDLKEVRLKNTGGGGIIKLTPEQGKYFLKLRGGFEQISKFSPEVESLVTKAKKFNSGEDFDKFLRSWNMENTPALGGKTPKDFWSEINQSLSQPIKTGEVSTPQNEYKMGKMTPELEALRNEPDLQIQRLVDPWKTAPQFDDYDTWIRSLGNDSPIKAGADSHETFNEIMAINGKIINGKFMINPKTGDFIPDIVKKSDMEVVGSAGHVGNFDDWQRRIGEEAARKLNYDDFVRGTIKDGKVNIYFDADKALNISDTQRIEALRTAAKSLIEKGQNPNLPVEVGMKSWTNPGEVIGEHVRANTLGELAGSTKSQISPESKISPNIGGEESLPKTIKTRRVSSISKTPYYEDTPIIRKEKNITLYQGSKQGEQRQFWTPNKKYAEKFGDVKEKTGDFYLVDNGNMVTDVYIEVPKSSQISPESGIKGKYYRFETDGTKNGDVKFYSKQKDYAEEYGKVRVEKGRTGKLIESDLELKNPLIVNAGDKEMANPDFEKIYIDKAKNNGNDGIIFRNGEDEFVAVINKNLSPESKTIKIKPNEDLVKTFDETIKIKPSEKIKVSSMSIEQPELKQRGFSASVQEAPDISKKTKIKVLGGYETKPNEQLMGEAKALLNEGVDLKNINKIENIDQKIAATIQEAINLDASGKHDEAAALFNNLSELGTQVGRGTQAFSLLNKMSPEAISLSVAGKIKKYNLSNVKKLPELTGDQQKSLSNQVREALKFPEGSRERGIAIGRVNETINSFIPSTIADKFITAWKAGLLSSLRTHERNIVGNVIMQTGEQASLYPASLADKLMSLKTGTRTLVPSQKGTIKGAIEGGQTAADVVRYGFDPMGTDIAKYEIKKVNWGNNPVEQALKKATDVVFNTLEAEDKVFWKSSYNRSLYNQAATEALNQGKKGDAKFIQQLFDNATEEMKKTAFNDANYSTFKDKNMLSGSIGQFKSWVNRQTGPAAEAGKVVSEMLMPFTGVPTSIVGKTIAYSPIGLVKGSINFGRVVSGSEVPGLQRQAAQEIGRGVIGGGIFGLGSYLMSQGLMTGQAKDEKERKQWELEGKQENSVLVNGKWRSINSVGPQTLVLLAGAKFNEMQNDPEQNLGTYGFSMAKDQLNQTFLSGVQQPLSALNEPYKAKSYLGGQVASLVPNIIKDTSKAFDPLAREVDTSTIGSSIKGRVQQSIPFVRNKMIPQRDVLGNEIAQTPTGIGAYVDLFNSKTPISNNVVNELSRLNDIGYNKTPTKLDKNQTIQGEKMVLNQAQLDRLEIVSGLATDKALNDLFNTTAYQSLNDAEKQDAIEDVITKTRKNVRAKINLKNIEEKSYTTSSDSQLAELGGLGMFTKSVTTNPKSAINALLTGNPIRKTSDGNIVVLERQNDIGSYDLGDTASQVDHSIPLSLGGTNEVRNLQILNNEEHAIKTKTDMYLLNQVKSGKMSLKDAQEKAKNWRDTALSIPKESQSQIIDEINSETAEKQSDGSQVYKIVSDAGNVTLVDLGTPIEEPKYTGFDELDKKLKSSYKSAVTKRINNIVKLYEDGQLSAKEAERYINELKTQSSATGTKSTKSKGGKITIKSAKYDIPKISVKFQETPSTIKLKSAPKIKVSSSNQRRYTIKA